MHAPISLQSAQTRVFQRALGGLVVPEQRLLGAYYTPVPVAGAMVSWALSDRPTKVLDPSYGEGVFLRSSVRKLAEVCGDPASWIHGIDIDPGCAQHVTDLALPSANLTHCDFLAMAPRALPGAPFGAIIGNPPFVRHHWLKGDTKMNALVTRELAEARLPGTASLWAYFVVHALQFLAEDGRFALILPEAVLQADYARSIRDLLAKRFGRTQLIQLRERVFSNTDESVVIVLGEGSGPGNLEVTTVSTVSELTRRLNGLTPRRPLITTENGRTMEQDSFHVLSSMLQDRNVKRFGEMARIRIGFVTGGNHYFIRPSSELDSLGVPESARLPVVTRTNWLDGLAYTEDDHKARFAADLRAFLVHPLKDYKGLRKWLKEGEDEGIPARFKCTERSPWYRVRLPERIPDAFASSTRQGLPRLALNVAGYHCSNTLHMVHWFSDSPVDARAILVGYHTSFCGLWAELNGRRYGGGLLKLDPGVLQRMPIPVIRSAARGFSDVDRLLRSGDEKSARALADEIALADGLGLAKRKIGALRRACESLENQRMPNRGCLNV